MNRILQFIDELSERIGRLVAWAVLAVVLIGSGNAIARYLGKGLGRELSANALQDLQWYLFSLVFLLGAAWTLKRDEHVRVDLLFHRLKPRARAWINAIGAALFLIPFCLVILWTSWPLVRDSWAIRELSPDPGGLPRYPIKTAVPIGFALLLLQGMAELVRNVRVLRGKAAAPAESIALSQEDKL